MDYLSIPLRTRAALRAKDTCGNFHNYPAAVGGIWTREGSGRRLNEKGRAWFEADEAASLRFVSNASSLLPYLRHNGWYVDNQQMETTMGVVYRLSHDRFLAGASDPWNCDKAGRGPFVCDESVYDSPEEAARAADRLAERYSEECREDDLKQTAEAWIEESRDCIGILREEIRGLVAGIRESFLSTVVCAQLKRDIRRLRKEIHAQWERISTLQTSPWEIVCR